MALLFWPKRQILKIVYEIFIQCAYLMIVLVQRFVPSIARQKIPQRDHGLDLQKLQAERSRFTNSLIFYCSSAGEIEQAQAIINRLVGTSTYIHMFVHSVSGYEHLKATSQTFSFSLAPVDRPCHWQKILSIIAPSAVIVVRNEMWYGFFTSVREYGIPLLIVNLTSGQHSFLEAFYRRQLVKMATRIYAVNEQAVQVFANPSIPSFIVGDTKFDRVFDRKVERENHILSLQSQIKKIYQDQKIFILGNGWRRDIQLVLEAYQELQDKSWKLIIVPHDLSDEHCEWIAQYSASLGLSSTVGLNEKAAESHILLIQERGVLFDYYALSDLAMVGGGLDQGVHNVLEPFVHGQQVFMGPNIFDQVEAQLLVEQDRAKLVQSSRDLLRMWRAWIDGDQEPQNVDLKKYLGASNHISEFIQEYLYEDSYSSEKSFQSSSK